MSQVCTILVVDDEPANLRTIVRTLQPLPCEVITAADAEAGLALIHEHCPDIILTDVRLPRMGGVELAKSIRELGYDIPIILISAYPEPIRKSEESFVAKPFNPDDLVDVLRKYIPL